VQFAGGWLFDQVMAGWDVTVLTTDQADARAVRILGARTADLETVLSHQVRGSCLQAIAVKADLCDSDSRVRRMVQEALDDGETNVLLWGDGPSDVAAGPVWHRLSVAARAFKAQALAAAEVVRFDGGDAAGGEAEVTEIFRRGDVTSARRLPA
jgi:hypothetical protein